VNRGALAYKLWQGRGCPEEDWFRALERNARVLKTLSGASLSGQVIFFSVMLGADTISMSSKILC
jgi:hypothetical protein